MGGDDRYAGRTLSQKLGVGPGTRVSVLGAGDSGLIEDLRRHGADVSPRPRRDTDLFLIRVDTAEDVASRLAELERSLRPNGGVWVIYPKGRKDIREVDVIAAGVSAGFVDNKVVRFSETDTALRFVIPRARRPAG